MGTKEISAELIDKIMKEFPDIKKEKFLDWHTLTVDRDDLLNLCELLKKEPELYFDFLTDLSGVDYLEYMEVVYHLYSYDKQHKLALKVRVTRDNPNVPSVTGLWSTADWHEREAYDLFGIVFQGHPNLKRIFCTEDFPGHAFRKDFALENDEEYLLRDTKSPEDYGIIRDLPS